MRREGEVPSHIMIYCITKSKHMSFRLLICPLLMDSFFRTCTCKEHSTIFAFRQMNSQHLFLHECIYTLLYNPACEITCIPHTNKLHRPSLWYWACASIDHIQSTKILFLMAKHSKCTIKVTLSFIFESLASIWREYFLVFCLQISSTVNA